ncbi:MAG: hypothetical protein D4Q79_02330 [Spirochaetia bacterium]|nr:MAG: hypothetical protein D4Q79_02330 [Spirochaetia bacterium]
MLKKTIIKYAFIHAVGAAAYIALIATLLSYASKIFGPANNSILGAMAFLLVFVISAAIMGLLILGKPAFWYLDGLKREAISLLFYTLGFLVLIAVVVFLILLIF